MRARVLGLTGPLEEEVTVGVGLGLDQVGPDRAGQARVGDADRDVVLAALLRGLISAGADLGSVGEGPVVRAVRPREGRLLARKLTDYRLSLYAAPAYLEAGPPIRTRADLSGRRFIGYIEELLYAPELDYLQAPDVEITARLKSSNLIAQLRAALAGGGLCVLPDFIAAGEPGLVRVLPEAVELTRSLWLLTHADLRGLARVKAVSEFIVEEVRASRAAFEGSGAAHDE